MKKIILISAAILFLASSGYPLYEEEELLHYRCGNLIVEKGVHSFQVLEECGDPVSQDVYWTGSGDEDGGDAYYIEKWVYGPEAGYYYVLFFRYGMLIRLDAVRVVY